jgi:hypothetical protein
MHTPAKRRLTLLDVMVFVAATGLGFGLARIEWEATKWAFPGWSLGDRPWLDLFQLVLTATGLGTIVLRLLPPRPRLRQLAREPGTLALIGILATVATDSVGTIPHWFVFGQSDIEHRWGIALVSYLRQIGSYLRLGPAVVLAWTIGAIQGLNWREADWVEWIGRAIGAAFVVLWITHTILDILACLG